MEAINVGKVKIRNDEQKVGKIQIPVIQGEEGKSGDYSKLSNKPSINGIILEGNKTSEELGIISGGLEKEEDPTVPSYVKQILEEDIAKWNNKSDFSGKYEDLENQPDIPTQISQLENDSGFVTEEDLPEADGILTGSIIGWNSDTIPEGYEEVKNEAEDVTDQITNIHSKIDMNNSSIKLLKQGNVINFRFYFARSGDWSTSDVILKIPLKFCADITIYAFVVGGGGATRRVDINPQGEVKVSGDASSTSWLGGNIVWIRNGGN